MSHDLIESAEQLLSESKESVLTEILKDYLLEKKFSLLISELDRNSRLQEICSDRDEWEEKHMAAFTEYWTPSMRFASFDKAKINYMSSDNASPVSLELSYHDYHCGNNYSEERTLDVFKEWFFTPDGEKPWIDFWNLSLILETQNEFAGVVKKEFPEQKLSWMYSLLGVSDVFFDSPRDLIIKKIARFQNFKWFTYQASKEKVDNLYELLVNFRIVIDPKDKEDGSTSLINYLNSLEKFSPVVINKILKDIIKEREIERKKEEKKKKAKELTRLSDKFSNTDLAELEELLRLKKELGK